MAELVIRGMSILEEVYLANVVLYFTDIRSIETLSFINKKCTDVLKIIRKSPTFKYSQNGLIRKWQINSLCAKQFSLFPNLQTFIVEPEFNEFNKIPDNIEYLEFKEREVPFDFIGLENKVSRFAFSNNQIPSDLKNFPSLKRLSLSPMGWISLSQLFSDKSRRIEVLNFSSVNGDIDVPFLMDIDNYNIEHFIIDVSTSYKLLETVRYLKLSHKIHLVSSFSNGIDDESVICSSKLFRVSLCQNSQINEAIIHKYYPCHLELASTYHPIQLDLSKHLFIQSIDASLSSKYLIEFPNQLTALTIMEFKCKGQLNCLKALQCRSIIESSLPTTLTCLRVISIPQPMFLPHLKELEVGCEIQDQKELTSLTSLTYMNQLHFNPVNLMNIKYLKTISQHLPPLNITALCMDCDIYFECNLLNQTCLKELILNNYPHSLELPPTVNSLVLLNLYGTATIHLDSFTTITTLIIHNCSNAFILPSSLKELYIRDCYGSIVNPQDISPKIISFDGQLSNNLIHFLETKQQ